MRIPAVLLILLVALGALAWVFAPGGGDVGRLTLVAVLVFAYLVVAAGFLMLAMEVRDALAEAAGRRCAEAKRRRRRARLRRLAA